MSASRQAVSTEWPDPIPSVLPAGGISLLAGAPGTGKTALLATLLRDFRDQQPIFGHQPSPITEIGLISTDRSWSTNAIWFERANYPEIKVYSVADDPTFKKDRLRQRQHRIRLFTEFVDKLALPPGGLVVVDPMALFLGGNLIDYDNCMVACLEMRDILRIRQLTMIGTAHTAKLKAEKKDRYLRPQDQILGSTAIFGYTDTQMYLASPAELNQPFYTFLWCPHMAPPESVNLVRDSQGLFIPYSAEHGGNLARVLQLFPESGDPIALVALTRRAQEVPISAATVKRMLEVLVSEGQVLRTGRGVYARALPA
jgi:hypothetical protein